MTIGGYNFSDATGVSFGGTAASFTINQDGSITAISPPGSGTENITVTSPEGTSAPVPYVYVPTPDILQVTPATGPVGGGNNVQIIGDGLAFATEVDFGPGNPGTITADYNGVLTVAVPAGALGTVDVTATNLSGTSATSPADQYTYLPPPTLTALDRSAGGFEGGTTVTITGTGLADASAVDFGPNNPATILSDTDSQIVVVTPPSQITDGGTGTIDVTVTTPDGTTATSTVDEFTYNHAPYVTQVSGLGADGQPSYSYQPVGLTTGGASVTISGEELSAATGVSFGGAPAASFTLNSDGSITAISPAGNVGTVDITVTNSDGTSDANPNDQFAYLALPTISAISPATGSINGGTTVEIDGTGLAYARWVKFGDVYANPLSVLSDTDNQILVVAPAGDTFNPVDITVVTPFATSATSPADQFTYMPAPEIDSIDTTSGLVSGGTVVTIDGSGLTGADVQFGGTAATIVGETDSQLVVVTPPAPGGVPGTADFTLTTPYGSITYMQYFTYALAPTVTGLSQTVSPVAGGTTTLIFGDNIIGAAAVYFGGVPAASFSFGGIGDQAAIVAVAPAGVVSTVDVTVVTAGGVSEITPADQFTYVAVPSVASVSPAEGPSAGGTTVTISGTGLAKATEVQFGGYDNDASIVSDTDTQLVVVSPQASEASEFVGPVDVIVTTAGGVSATSAADQFTYIAAPTVDDLSQTSGFRDGGDSVTIYGTNLDTVTSVYFGANAATIIDESATSIDVTTPAGALGLANVTVVNPGGTSTPSSQDQFTYFQRAPAIDGVSPAVGAAAGATVTIPGTDLDGASEVDFGGVAGTILTDSPDQFTATPPAGIVGTVDVTVVTPGGVSAIDLADQFTGVPAPTVTGVVQSSGSAGGGSEVVIYGSALADASVVDFGQTAASILESTDDYVSVICPPGVAGAVDVTVTTPYGTSATSSADQFSSLAAPTIAAESYSATQGTTLTITGPGVLAGAADPQDLPLSAVLLSGTQNGTLSLNSDGSFSYTPNSGFLGTDSFVFQATDGVVSSMSATATITAGPGTMTWSGGASGNWTDSSWTGSTATYPAGAAGAVVDNASTVAVGDAESANSLQIGGGGQVAVGPGGVPGGDRRYRHQWRHAQRRSRWRFFHRRHTHARRRRHALRRRGLRRRVST